jgi:hypothetical protein
MPAAVGVVNTATLVVWQLRAAAQVVIRLRVQDLLR